MDCPAKVIHMSNVNSTYHQKLKKIKKNNNKKKTKSRGILI